MSAKTLMMINSITFNQDNSCISISTDEYHKIFNAEPFGEIYHNELPTIFIKILFSTSLTIIIPKEKDNRVLKIHNLKQNLKICELIFPSTIIDVKVNKKRLVVVLAIGQLYIYDLSCVKLMKIIEINKVKNFIGDLSQDEHSLLVLPLNLINDDNEILVKNDIKKLVKFDGEVNLHQVKNEGWMLVYDTINLKPKLIMKCHSSNLKKIVISNDLIATASVRGTIIRVFYFKFTETLELFKIQNLRRGRNMANVNVLKFNKDNSILGCGSESNTIHFFNLHDDDNDHYDEGDELDDDEPPLDDNQDYQGYNDHDPTSHENSDEDSKLSEDLNENLANLLISKPPEIDNQSYFSIFNKKIINSPYTKKIMKRLPYKEYFNNLILKPPKRSFCSIKLKSHHGHNQVELGFLDDLILVVSYSLGEYYQYKLPTTSDPKCKLMNQFSLV